jgi:hypothetical protein
MTRFREVFSAVGRSQVARRERIDAASVARVCDFVNPQAQVAQRSSSDDEGAGCVPAPLRLSLADRGHRLNRAG